MNTRLTNAIRERITKAVLTHRFQEAVEALIADRVAFAEDVYNDIYRKADREKMAALPDGWLPTNHKIDARFGYDSGGFASVSFSGSIYGPVSSIIKTTTSSERVERRVLSKRAYGCAKVYEATHKLSLRYVELDQRFNDLKTAFDGAKRQVEAALNSATTVKSLIKLWPEIEPFAKSFSDEPVKLPALPTEHLNKILDLPVAA